MCDGVNITTETPEYHHEIKPKHLYVPDSKKIKYMYLQWWITGMKYGSKELVSL